MNDYREIQIRQLEKKIEETRALLSEPGLSELAIKEIEELELQKKSLEESLASSYDISSSESDDLDQRNALLEVSGAAGGDEASLFANELLRMYTRFAEKKGLRIEPIDEHTIKVSGDHPFGTFKYEAGVHRVQRIPKTEKKGRIHTSTVTVSILPELEDVDLHISPDDIEFEAFRSGGHGGQNVNKVSTAVRVKHTPSGIVVTSQSERSQNQNREIAMKLLRAKLWEMELEKQHKEISSLKATQVGRGMRAEKIKTYNFPQNRLTDHRANRSWHNLELILDGETLSEIIEETKNSFASAE